MQTMTMLRRATFALLLAGCSNAGESLTFPALPEGGIAVSFFLDRDATGSYTTNDTTMAGVRVALLAANGVDTIQTMLSNATGVAIFGPVPIGRYRVVVDRAALGDTIGVVVGDTGTISILARQDSNTATRLVRLGFEEVTVAQALALPAGRRVIVRGSVVSPMQAFRDSTMFLLDATGALRITSARHWPGRIGNNLGDSVAVLGTTGVSLGRAVLLAGKVSSLGVGSAPAPQLVTVAEVRTARGGTLDAALVQVTNAKVVDTATVALDLRVTFSEAADDADRAVALFDQLLQAPAAIFTAGRTITVRGVLVPRGDGTWWVKPRNGSDLTLGS
ncbi:MAG: hypothetical protein IPP98_12600 [Gemmatimonadetes bacterium]|nr:hypothetical protein [Gemmatimonadota bacterium]